MSASERVPAARLVAAGVQTFLYGWVTVAALAILTFTLKADSPALGDATWQDAARIATGWWLTAFGGTLHFGGVQITLPPLTITIITFLVAWSFVRRLPLKDWRDLMILAASGAVTVGLLGQLAPNGSIAWRAALGAAIILLLSAVVSRNRTDWFGQGFFTTPAGRVLYDGFMLALAATAIILVLSLVTAGLGLLLGWSQIRTIAGFYVIDILAWILLWGFQLCYLPTMVIWAGAYLLGAGFSIGSGTSFSALGVESAPLPAVPLLGALPQPHVSVPWVIPLVALIIFAAGWRKSRAFPTLNEAGATGGLHILLVFLIFAIIGGLASGSVGPERMQVLGPEPPKLALAAALVAGIPMLAGLLAGNRVTIAKVKDIYANYRSRDKGTENSDTDHWVDDGGAKDESSNVDVTASQDASPRDGVDHGTAAGQSAGVAPRGQATADTPIAGDGSGSEIAPAIGRERDSHPATGAHAATETAEVSEGADGSDGTGDTDGAQDAGERPKRGWFSALKASLAWQTPERPHRTKSARRDALPAPEPGGGIEEDDADGILLEDDTEVAYQRVEPSDDWARDLPSAPTAPMDDKENP
ncbi:MAG: DUF6350 family protein [Flaviflexus sp.]|nr:DUF6350 family protein [Flaviflexus sp.]